MTTRRGMTDGKREGGRGKGKSARSPSPFPLPPSPRAGWTPLLLAGVLACGNPGSGKTAFVGATVFDGTGAPLILDAVIVVANGHIEAVGPPDVVAVPRGALEVRLDGRFVVPGLIDAHTHVERWMLGPLLAHGVTTIRDAGGPIPDIYQLRDSVSLRTIAGPTMYIAGPVIDGRGSAVPGAVQAGNAREARRAVDELVLANAHHAKVHAKITRTLLTPLMDEAVTLRTPVMAHLGKVDALTAARLGVRSIEHLTGIVEAAAPNPAQFYNAHDAYYAGWNLVGRAWADVDGRTLERIARQLVQSNVAMVPTLVLHETYSRLGDAAYTRSVDVSAVPDDVRQRWDVRGLVRRAGLTPAMQAALRRSRPAQDRFVRLYHEAGGLVGVGTDTPQPLIPPGASLHRELALLVAAGFTPEQALLAATRENARLLAADSIGTIRPGAIADFVVLGANPLDDIGNTRTVEMVVSRGAVFRPDQLVPR